MGEKEKEEVKLRDHPMVSGCRSVEAYEKISHIDEGTYGIVWKAKERASGKVRANGRRGQGAMTGGEERTEGGG